MLVIRDEQCDYERSFQVLEIPATFASAGDLRAMADSDARFDAVAAPVGFGGNKPRVGRSEWLDRCRAARRLIQPEGVLLVGFSNRWDVRRKIRSQASSVGEMRSILLELGFRSIRFFGAVPEPLAPEYIFPLQPRSLGFVLDQRYRHKLPQLVLSLAHTRAAHFLLNFMPFYYAVALAGE